MKKIFERMMQDARLAGNNELSALQQSYLDAKNLVKQAKSDKTVAKTAYQKAVKRGEKDGLLLMELITVYRQAKHMLHYQELQEDLTKFKLYQWLDNWSREMAVPQSSKDKKEKRKEAPAPVAKVKKNVGESASSIEKSAEPKKNGHKS